MPQDIQPEVLSALRWLLAVLGTWLVSHGLASATDTQALLTAGPGAVMAVAAVAYGIWNAKWHKREVDTALTVSTPEELKAKLAAPPTPPPPTIIEAIKAMTPAQRWEVQQLINAPAPPKQP